MPSRGAAPACTVATSRTKTGVPRVALSGTSSRSLSERKSPSARTS